MTLGVVTISYNQARFLGEAIESVRLSDRSQLKYVVVDPGSTDGSRELIEANKSRFTKTILEPDLGPADGLNKGFAACDADLYGYINADDRFSPGALDFVQRYFETHPEVDVLLGAVKLIDEKGSARIRKAIPWGFNLKSNLIGTANFCQPGSFFRKRAWRMTSGFNPANRTCWDWELFIDMMLAGAKFKTAYRVLGEFRIYGGSLSGSGALYSPEGKLNCQYLADLARNRQKIAAFGITPPSRSVVSLLSLAHKFNPLRRFVELFAN